MILHQPGDNIGVEITQSVAQAKFHGVVCPQFGMIAAAAFGDIVKQAGEVK